MSRFLILFMISFSISAFAQSNAVDQLLKDAYFKRVKQDYAASSELLWQAKEQIDAQKHPELAHIVDIKLLWLELSPAEANIEVFQKNKQKLLPQIKQLAVKNPLYQVILDFVALEDEYIAYDDLDKAEQIFNKITKQLEKYPNKEMELASLYLAADLFIGTKKNELSKKLQDQLLKELPSHTNDPQRAKNSHRYLFPHYEHLIYELQAYNLQLAEAPTAEILESYNKYLSVLKKQPLLDSLKLAETLSYMGLLHGFYAEDYAKTLEFYQNALLYVPKRYHIKVAEIHDAIGDVYITHAIDDKAIVAFEKSVESYKKAPHSDKIDSLLIITYRSMATAYVKLEKYPLAKAYLNKIGELPASLDALRSWTYATWGFLYEHTKEYDKSIEAHKQSIVEYKKEGVQPGSAYWNLGKIYYLKEDYKASLKNYHINLAFDSLPGIVEEDIFSLPDPQAISEIAKNSKSVADKLKAYYKYVSSNDLWEEHEGRLISLLNITLNAFDYHRKKQERELSKVNLLGFAYTNYELAVTIYTDLYERTKDQKHLEEAFKWVETSKSVLLSDALKEEEAKEQAGIPQNLMNQEKNMEKQMTNFQFQIKLKQDRQEDAAALTAQLFTLKQDYDALRLKIEKEYPRYFELKNSFSPISVATIQEQLSDQQSIIEYFEGSQNLFAFTITKNTLSYKKVQHDAIYKKQIQSLREQTSSVATVAKDLNAACERYKKTAYAVYKDLWSEGIAEQTKKIILIPDGQLNYIAFEALIEEEKGESFAELPYLVHKYIFSYNYSASMWLDNLDRKNNMEQHDVLAMAASYNPSSYEPSALRGSLDPIPGTLEELERIKQRLDGAFYKDDAASEAAFKSKVSEFGIVHLAMHGIVDSKLPDFSKMAFTDSDESKEDNFLHAFEIKQLDLNADLVVLSACETGFGKYEHGEGVISLGRSFMYAGSPSVVMTLWQLHDQASIDLIDQFYKNLAEGMPKDKALQKAKLAYLEQAEGVGAHPALWAAFIQLGDTQPLQIQPASNQSFSWWWLMGGLLLLPLAFLFLGRKRPKESA